MALARQLLRDRSATESQRGSARDSPRREFGDHRSRSDFVYRESGPAETTFLYCCLVWFVPRTADRAGKDRQLYDHIQDEKAEKLANRYGEITAIDRSVGWLREALREQGVQRDTILWYCSDNGEPSNSWYKPKLNGSKGNLFEGGIRVPAIIEWPAGIPQHGHSSVSCVTSDMLPTICDWLDLPLPDRVLDGISLVPLLQGKIKERPEPIEFWRYGGSDEEANGPWMPPESQLGTTPTAGNPATQFMNYRHPVARTEFGGDAAIIDGRYKLIVDTTGRHREKEKVITLLEQDLGLFDLIDDPAETKNLAAAHPERVQQLLKKLRQWQASVEQSLTGAEYQK